MKIKQISASFTIVIAMFIAVCAHAQTNDTPTGLPSFFVTAENYFTSINTNYTFAGTKLEVATGYKQEIGVAAANFLDAQYDIGNFSLASSFQFSGVGSAVNGLEAGVGYALIEEYDTKLEFTFFAGYDSTERASEIEPELAVKKKLTANTYAETTISFPQDFGSENPLYPARGKFNSSPSFKAGLGFTF